VREVGKSKEERARERERGGGRETERSLEGGGEESGSHHVQGCFDCDEVT